MNKIIVSSEALFLLLHSFCIQNKAYSDNNIFTIDVIERRFSIEEFGLKLDVSDSNFTINYLFRDLKKLKKILKKVPNQPLEILFDESKGIEIKSIII